MRYYGAVYRPPSEARSLIIQVTLGCSNNTCAFCTMYKAKRFQIRPMEDVLRDMEEISREYPGVKRVFLADGDALAVDTTHLLEIIDAAYRLYPSLERVTSYATPVSLLEKSPHELRLLRERGLHMLYMGLESGSDDVLKLMMKGNSCAEIVSAGRKAREAGFALSVTAITGLGGREMTEDHAVATARALSEMNPEYIGLLTLMVDEGTPLARWISEGRFRLLNADEVLEETLLTIRNIDSPGSVFRMNHASNYLSLRGVFNQDRERMISQIERASSDKSMLKPENYRLL